MKPVIEVFELNEDYMLQLRIGDQATEQHFVSYFGRLLQIKIRRRLACAWHIEDIRREAIAQALAVIRSNPLTPPERLGELVNAACNKLLREYRPAACCQAAGDSLVNHQDKASDANNKEKVLVRDLVQQVLHQLPSSDRQTLRTAILKNGSNGKHEVRNRDHLRLLLLQANQMFCSKLRNARKVESI
jgi:RNA polymerase sigma-70 factor (ECF subfamily)